nr:dephospho-CoA kinase [uncultured Anaerostipes sp.]
MKIIGITGGVGSGKSEILNILENEYGARIIIADLVAHKLMEPDGISYKGIVKAFGKGIVKADGFIDREVLGSIVFCSERKLKILNEITHKNVDAEIMRQIEEIRKEDPNALVVCEAALLVGAQYESLFDQLWYIYTKEEIRFRRLKASRGYSDRKIRQMMESQKTEEEFKAAATHVIDNSGDLEETRRQIREILGDAAQSPAASGF